MKHYIYIFLVTSVIFMVVDGIWLGLVAFPLYQKTIGSLLKDIDILPAVIFYVIYVIGMIYFVIHPNLREIELDKLLLSGFLFGVVCYATYDLTNMATLQDWSWKITFIDIVWGGLVTMSTTTIVTYIFQGMIQ